MGQHGNPRLNPGLHAGVMDTMAKGRKREAATLALLLILLIAALLVIAVGHEQGASPPPVGDAPELSAASIAEPAVDPIPTPRKSQSQTDTRTGSLEGQQEVVPEQPRLEVVLTFTNQAGAPQAGLAFEFSLINETTLRDFFQRGVNTRIERLDNVGLTDPNGNFVISERLIVPKSVAILFRVIDSQCTVVRAPAFSAPLPRGFYAGRVGNCSNHISVIVSSADSRIIEVYYEDGQPIVGEVRVVFVKAGRELRGCQSFRTNGVPWIEVRSVPAGVALRVLFFSVRLGFQARPSFKFAEDGPQPLVCVLKRSAKPQAGIRVEVRGIDPAESCQVNIRDGRASYVGGEDRVGPGIYEWVGDDLYGEYAVQVRCRGTRAAFRAERIKLCAGEFVTIVAEPKPPVAYKATAVNEQGDPVWPSVLTSDLQFWPDYVLARNSRGAAASDEQNGRATGDSEGRSELSGVASSVRELVLWAEGYDPVIIPVSGLPGQTIDLGAIRLNRARGSISIVLLNCVDGVVYRCTLLRPWGGPVVGPRSVAGSTATFHSLPIRDYCVFVDAGNGFRGVSTAVALSNDSPSRTIEIDVSACQTQK